ncbi:TRAP transporter small permease [Sulfitobacter aestuarii]|uniref:TRAP transporter small permease protein n=1 Tax=Sulfitobacter aestuarii TaxID=2161676 RepID=A0ABW5U5X2_9RHOB
MRRQAGSYLVAAVSKLLATLACGALFVMAVLTFIDVIGRYGFNNSIFGASELVELLMVAVVFAGFAFVTATDQHICVTFFDHLLTERAPALMRWSRFLFSLVVYALLLYILWDMALDALANARTTIVLALPIWLFPGIAAALSSLGFILFLLSYPLREDDPHG